jgi:DegV family protein with EDD domain
MAIKIVTDSASDISAEIAEKLGITIVPLYVRFGKEEFRERVTITDEEFYKRLIEGSVHPQTSEPNMQDFLNAYKSIYKGADAIVSIHISAKLSGTYNSAVQAKNALISSEQTEKLCPIEVVDSLLVTVPQGLAVIAAAKAAKQGKSLEQVLAAAKEAIDNAQPLCLLDTLKYLQLGGRIGKAKALLGNILNVKPLITIRGGEVLPSGQARSRAKGLDMLFGFVKNAVRVDDLAIGYCTTLDDAIALSQRLSTLPNVPKAMLFRMGTTLGVHTGPGTIIVSFTGKLADQQPS